jgi:hypothetical protein
MMISREQVANRVGAAGWEFSREGRRVYIYRRKGFGNAQRIDLPKRDLYPELTVRTILRQAGISPGEIEAFIVGAAKQ